MTFDPLFIAMAGDEAEVTPEAGGSKAAQLWRMGRLGLPVPPAFVLPTALCAAVNSGEAGALAALDRGLAAGIARLEAATGRSFGDARAPLLVSVRSGAAQSMPGMLSTVLDVGLNAASLRGLIRLTGNPRLAWDSWRRFVQLYAEVVEGLPAAPFEARLAELIRAEDVAAESELDGEALERLTHEFLALAARQLGRPLPSDPRSQLAAAARAVYRSWDGRRAQDYRRLNGLDGLAGTAVTVQAMVFGNAGGTSGAGVAFSRDPATGERRLYLDFLFDAQGEDVVAGRRPPGNGERLAARLPAVAAALAAGAERLERELGDLQDIEFTVEEGRLFFLQTRAAKRTPRATLRVLVDFVREGLLDPATALERAAAIDLDQVRLTRFAEPAPAVATAVVAAPGVASGRAAFDSLRAQAFAEAGEPAILVRHDTSTDDVAGFAAADGILTAVGGRTAHAAVVARQLGKVCLVGCAALRLDPGGRSATLGERTIAEGDWLSLDGADGSVTLGRRAIVAEAPEAELAELERWRRATAEPVALQGD
ncbi:pyruvate phosphate dikinase [Tistlia consotensis]|uniref:Pyruvate phosphate dikinase n=1 Tax=Tistlia consotensis USBA 355 TaxID=560819 RepID=A0A1Y6B9P7_9PROT|nr:PEP/pyruvate-binding domain-containing protein [Tistlia consotensis]SME96663.1 pyruvate phosphate dikinase [Tistlia consotensis USBA 355]SNR55998.1 pyruvate phosphate dikinase [Tistlia consotensis]